ncbi:MAG: sulfite exporter TauE/SafE family protein [Myxococcota bacterium]|nr:sulfite exporter TauE/SafE family protein [Myxococcota bacterium]
MAVELMEISVGFGVGTLVGALGIGGGALLMPFLLLGFGLTPLVAVGTDLAFAGVVKSFGVYWHSKSDSVDWKWVRALVMGSLPGVTLSTVLTGILGARFPEAMNQFVAGATGVVIAALAVFSLWRTFRGPLRNGPSLGVLPQSVLTHVIGFGVGILVGLTSIGSGTVIGLFLLASTGLSARRVVGTDLAHSLILVLLSAVLHGFYGHIAWGTWFGLILGGIPGVWLGVQFATSFPDRVIRVGISVALIVSGVALVNHIPS